jgi:hypothetical protein
MGVLPLAEVVSTTAIFGGMDGQNASPSPGLLDPDQGVTSQPIVRVDQIEWTDMVLGLKHVVHERPAHVIDLIHEIGMEVERATVMMNAIDPCIMRLTLGHPRKDMQFMPFTLQRRSQFGNMHTHAAHTNRMQRFPRQHRDSHN